MSADQDVIKRSSSFIYLYDFTFRLWKSKQNTEDNQHSAEKGRSYIRPIHLFLTPHNTVQIMGVTSIYTVNNQQKFHSVKTITSIFKNWVQWGDIILLTL